LPAVCETVLAGRLQNQINVILVIVYCCYYSSFTVPYNLGTVKSCEINKSFLFTCIQKKTAALPPLGFGQFLIVIQSVVEYKLGLGGAAENVKQRKILQCRH